jgi:hypothetical protein
MAEITVEGVTRLKCMCGEHYCRYCNYNYTGGCSGEILNCPNCGCRVGKPLDSQQFIKAVMEKNNVVPS